MTKNKRVVAPASTEPTVTKETPAAVSGQQKIRRYANEHKWLAIPAALALAVAVTLIAPPSRYWLLGLFMQQSVTVKVLDSQTHSGVSQAIVAIGTANVRTDNAGLATIRSAVGSRQLTINKQYYQAATGSIFVPLKHHSSVTTFALKATGRMVPVSVIDAVSGRPISNAQVSAAGVSSTTLADGTATLVLPADKESLPASVAAKQYNRLQGSIVITAQPGKNVFGLIPAGKVYYMSNQSGSNAVVRANLDGSNVETIYALGDKGVGWQPYISQDQHYIVAGSTDSPNHTIVNLIDTTTRTITEIDDGNIQFTPIGWNGNTFMYAITRNDIRFGYAKRDAVKAYNVATKQLAVLDESKADTLPDQDFSYAAQSFGSFLLINGTLTYSVHWNIPYAWSYGYDLFSNRTDSVRSMQTNGQNKKDIATFSSYKVPYYTASVDCPNRAAYTVYYQRPDYQEAATTAYTVTTKGLQPVPADTSDDQSQPLACVVSPNGASTAWTNYVDGKQVVYVGDKDAQGRKQAATLDSRNATIYSWLGNEYLIVSDIQNRALYLVSKNPKNLNQKPLQIINYNDLLVVAPS